VPRQIAPDPRLGKTLRRLRGDRTQENVAHGAGMSLNAYGKTERGLTSPSFDTLLQILGGLGVTVVEFAEEFERIDV